MPSGGKRKGAGRPRSLSEWGEIGVGQFCERYYRKVVGIRLLKEKKEFYKNYHKEIGPLRKKNLNQRKKFTKLSMEVHRELVDEALATDHIIPISNASEFSNQQSLRCLKMEQLEIMKILRKRRGTNRFDFTLLI